MKRLIPLLIIGTILYCASNLDHDLAFLEVAPDIRYQRPITVNYYEWHDALITLRCGVTADTYRCSLLLYRLGRIKKEDVYLQERDLQQWGL